MSQNLTREDCINILKEKYKEKNQLPKKSDFTDYQVMMIKSFLGPWPRALEASGVKPARNSEKLLKKQEKRERAKQRKQEFKNE